MSDSISFDFSELNKLAADLSEVPSNAGPFINSAVQFTATNVKKDSQASVRAGSSRWKAAPKAISYDVKAEAGVGGSSITVEVGYEKGGGGDLGNLREFGAPGKGLGPHNDLANALEKNTPDFEKGLNKALADAEKKAGL